MSLFEIFYGAKIVESATNKLRWRKKVVDSNIDNLKVTESKASDEAVANDEVQSGNDESTEEKVEEKTAENQ